MIVHKHLNYSTSFGVELNWNKKRRLVKCRIFFWQIVTQKKYSFCRCNFQIHKNNFNIQHLTHILFLKNVNGEPIFQPDFYKRLKNWVFFYQKKQSKQVLWNIIHKNKGFFASSQHPKKVRLLKFLFDSFFRLFLSVNYVCRQWRHTIFLTSDK